MNPFDMVVAIVVVGAVAGVLNNWIKHRPLRRRDGRDEERAQRRLEELERRVETLEAIVTDKRFGLRQSFDDLEARRRV